MYTAMGTYGCCPTVVYTAPHRGGRGFAYALLLIALIILLALGFTDIGKCII